MIFNRPSTSPAHESRFPKIPELNIIGKIDVIEWHLALVGLRKWLPPMPGNNFA